MKSIFVVGLLVLANVVRVGGDDQGEVRQILDAYQEVRPGAAELELYQLDWAPTLTAAKERAAKERRPIFLILVTNSFGDFASGHC